MVRPQKLTMLFLVQKYLNSLKAIKRLIQGHQNIANIDENYAVTSRTNNRGKTVGKFAKQSKKLSRK
ncbi:hypothetical protein DMB90_09230 [Raoultella planticola]|uniref:Uncharacterized protein n=1 Tax=Raoultella planticola TaxID=575 RepID=A0A5P6A9Y8_RAOPL|nr:hypothetical protein DMB90_09230 [Raoultella planticola]